MQQESQAASAPLTAQPVRSSRRRLWLTVAVVVVITACALSLWPRRVRTGLEPPLPDLAGVDAEVAEAIQAARADVLKEGPSSATWGRLGEVLLAHDFNVEANRCFAEAERLDAHDLTWPYLQGYNLVIHDPDIGISCLERAAERSGPLDNVPRLFLAEVFLERGRLDEGEKLLKQVRGAERNNLRARLGLGHLAMLRQQWRTALDELELCRGDVHTRKRALTLSAEAWNQLGDTKRAGDEQRAATALAPDQPWPDPYYEQVQKELCGLHARFNAVAHLTMSGRPEDAIRLLQQTVELYPASFEAWMRLGEMWQRGNRLDRAGECLQQATKLAPDMAEAWTRLGTVQALLHKREAIDSLRHALRLKPDHAQAHFNLGQCLLNDAGDRAGAAREFQAALNCRPDYELARKALHDLEATERKPR